MYSTPQARRNQLCSINLIALVPPVHRLRNTGHGRESRWRQQLDHGWHSHDRQPRTTSTTRLRTTCPTWTPYFLEPQDIGETLQAYMRWNYMSALNLKKLKPVLSNIASIISTISAPPSDRQIWLLSYQHCRIMMQLCACYSAQVRRGEYCRWCIS